MKRQALTGWYCDAQPDGTYAVLIPDSHIATSHGDVPLPGRNVLFLVCGRVDGVLCLAGQGGDDGQGWVWNGTEWRAVCATYGTSPCAFHPAGVLYVSMPTDIGNIAVFNPRTFEQTSALTQPVGARGIAAVDQFGVHSVDGWYGGDLAEYVDLDGIHVGQDWTDGCAISGRLLEPGIVYFIRAHRDGDSIAVALWKPKEALAVCFWFTVAEIASLPLVSAPVPPPIVLPPVEPPKMLTIPTPPRAAAIVQALYEKHVALAEGSDDDRRALMKLIAEQQCFELGPGWGTKSAGPGRPPTKDAIAFTDGGHLFVADAFNGTTRKPSVAAVMDDSPGQVFIAVPAINHLGDVTVPPPSNPPPSNPPTTTDYEARIHLLEQTVSRILTVLHSA